MTRPAGSATLPSRRTLLRAVRERDPDWDGLFVFAVTTTGVACRPSCPSRRARPEHVEFYHSLAAATSAGFRACRRCRPDAGSGEPPWWTRAMALASERAPRGISDAELRDAGLDPVRLRRRARQVHGMTFHALVRSQRIAVAQRRLREGEELDTVIATSGWDSHSGFRDAFRRVAGGTPGSRRAAEPIAIRRLDSPVGPLVAAAVDAGICLLEFDESARLARQMAGLARRFHGPIVPDAHPYLDALAEELEAYFTRRLMHFRVPLAIRGTDFEESVWRALATIPYGETRSYIEIATAIGNPGAVRAVGSANGRNRLAIVIPCHRVINADGKLGGYGGGLWRKQRLLELERGVGGETRDVRRET
jgi:AraC family transcriptional regulator of adaptative response/methylated-DNA-[protein]-cysteine methyltransferase